MGLKVLHEMLLDGSNYTAATDGFLFGVLKPSTLTFRSLMLHQTSLPNLTLNPELLNVYIVFKSSLVGCAPFSGSGFEVR